MERTQAKYTQIEIPCSTTQKEVVRIAARERGMRMSQFIYDCVSHYERDYEPLLDDDADVLVAADVLSWTRSDVAADQGARAARSALRSIKRLERALPGTPDLARAHDAARDAYKALEEVFGLLDAVGEQAHISDPTWLHPLEGRTQSKDADEKEEPCQS